jgi:hypothetical protein
MIIWDAELDILLAKILIIVIVLNAVVTFFYHYYDNPWKQALKMGRMKTWWIFGFEWWGNVKPFQMTKNNIVYKPLFLGLWFRERSE